MRLRNNALADLNKQRYAYNYVSSVTRGVPRVNHKTFKRVFVSRGTSAVYFLLSSRLRMLRRHEGWCGRRCIIYRIALLQSRFPKGPMRSAEYRGCTQRIPVAVANSRNRLMNLC